MADITSIYALLGGKSKGFGPNVLRFGLRLIEPVYAAAVAIKNRRYDRNPGLAKHVNATVISIGNLTTGGTGKTPLIAMIAKWLDQQGISVGFISRGYGSTDDQLNDEGRELKWQLPLVPHVQNRDRILAANQLLANSTVQVILCDDCFQHRRLYRDLDIVVIDATNPFGFNHLLPRGLLREPVSSLKRANIALITRSDQVSEKELEKIKNTIRETNPTMVVASSIQRPTGWVSLSGQTYPLTELMGKALFSFCGIGNPTAFNRNLVNGGFMVVGSRSFPDHHHFTHGDIESVQQLAAPLQAEHIVCTVKDLVKIREIENASADIFALKVETEIVDQERQFLDTLKGCIKPT